MSDAYPRLEGSIREHLAPVLRRDGFHGSGRTFRRVQNALIQVLSVQGSRYGGQFAINLAVQPCAIPDARGEEPDPKTIREELCEFRRRLSEEGADQWWKHEGTKESMDAAMRLAANVYVGVGRELLAKVASLESPLWHVSAKQFENGQFEFAGFGSTKVRMVLALARLRRAQGDVAAGREFASLGLQNIGNASALRHELEKLCA
jgi:hypothetical protein